MATNRLPVVGVLGSGEEPWEPRSSALGEWLAAIDVHLLTGGGGGVMEAVSRAFCGVHERRGLSIGIIPAQKDPDTDAYVGPKADYPNPFVELPIQTHLHRSGSRGTDELSRNHINVLSSHVLVALPGSAGTASEVRLAALDYERPVIAFVDERSQIPDLPDSVEDTPTLEAVQKFVLAALSAIPGVEYTPPAAS